MFILAAAFHSAAQTTVDTTATCSPSCNGAITINASGGTAPYNYSIDGGNTFSPNNTFSGLCLDTFNIVVTDAGANTIYTGTASTAPQGCQQLSSPLFYTYNILSSDSFGIMGITHCTGAINFTVSGGVPPYMLALENVSTGVISPLQSSTSFDSLCTGYYILHIADAVGSQFCYCSMPTMIFIPKECMVPANAFVSGYTCPIAAPAEPTLTAFSVDMTAMYIWSSSTLSFANQYSPVTTASGTPGNHIATVDIIVNGCPPMQYMVPVTLCSTLGRTVSFYNGQICAFVSQNIPPLTVTWYEGATMISNDTCIAAPADTTTYTVIVENQCGCSDTMLFAYTPASMNEIVASRLLIYPNPSPGIISVTGDAIELKRIIISDISGRQVMSIEKPRKEIDISSLADGAYFISAENVSGIFFRERILKTGR